MNRIICAITLVYIIIIMGLYKFGIVLFNVQINNDVKENALIIEYIKDTEYMNVYKAKIKTKNFFIYIKKQNKKLDIGDIVFVEGKFKEPETRRNYGGFNYKMYLRSKNIYGSIKIEHYKFKESKKGIYWKYKRFVNKIRKSIIILFDKNLSKKNSSLLKGLIVGDKSDIQEDVLESFRNASLSHILAISGAHFSYIILILNYINKKIKIKRLGNWISIVIMLFFIELTGCTPSVLRAGIMNIIVIFSKLIYRKYDFWTNLSFSLLIQMLINPYVIFDVGLQLSYLGVIGIVTLYDKVLKYTKFKIISVTIAANIIIIPIMMYNFNTLSFSFVISNIFASIILGPIIILGLLSVFTRSKIIFIFLNVLLSLLSKIAELCAKIPLAKINVFTPSLISIVIYYLFIYIALKNNKIIISKKIKENKNKKYKNNNKCKNKVNIQKKIIWVTICLILVFNFNYECIIANAQGYLLINFVDVSQGDCTLIRYEGKNILIDGGGSENNNIGKNLLLPYILDRKINHIDYMIFSHFDSDHAQGLLYLLDKINVENIVIGIQKENYFNYKKLCKILNDKTKNKKIKNKKLIILDIGKEIRIKDLRLICLWPNSKKLIGDNSINNNSLVLKVVYNKFSMLFTGDIEEIAEKDILKEYKRDTEYLKSTVLKIAHHGSKTSTSEEFLSAVSPNIALIGVGKDNKFGHPSNENIKKLMNKRISIYRTDKMGEVTIKVSKKGIIKVNNFLKNTYN